MMDNISFVDLVSLMRITSDSTVERFGSLINSSFFDASNILGTLKQKGLVDFVTQFPSQSAITVTEQGKQLIAEAEQKATSPLDKLDMELLKKISEGNKTLPDISANINITPKDLAAHLYKLSVQQFMSYELRNGSIDIKLTEKGFLTVKEGPQLAQQGNEQQAQSEATPKEGEADQPKLADNPDIQKYAPPKTEEDLKAIEAKIMKEKRTDRLILAAIIVVIAVIVLYLYLVGAI